MFSIWTLIAVALAYILILFVVATLGNKAKELPSSVYSLALGIHCTSWAFFGTTTQATHFGWPLVPTYLGVIMVMLFGFDLLQRVNAICKQYNITSIAEFIGVRYEHSNTIVFIVSLICVIGVIPYIALQLDAITLAINTLVQDHGQRSGSISLYVTLSMVVFAIWFGARQLNLLAGNPGLMLTIAFQSVIKLFALLVVGLFAVYWVFDGLVDLFIESIRVPEAKEIIDQPFATWIYLSHIVLGVCSMFCLPRQFHVNFVENRNDEELKQARWLFPLYLLGMSMFVLPIALAGSILFEGQEITPDSYVLAIPQSMKASGVLIIAFIGGLAASSSMIIVSTLALGNMVANSIITPLWLQFKQNKFSSQLSSRQILRIRQVTIIVIMFTAYWYHQFISQNATLVETGTIAISLLSQTLPAILLGIYWKNASKTGAICGLLAGVSTILIGMLYPAIQTAISGNTGLDGNQIANVLFSAFAINTILIIVVSLVFSVSRTNPYAVSALRISSYSIDYASLLNLTDRLLPQDVAQEFKNNVKYAGNTSEKSAPQTLLVRAENLLAANVGSASARILLNAISKKQHSSKKDIRALVEEAGKDIQLNKEILQASITHLPLGISVIDKEFKLLAWNNFYETLFSYPQNYLKVGMPIVEILEYNADRGLLGSGDTELEIKKRMKNIVAQKTYKTVRPQINNKVIEISGNPLPSGGFITCYADITEYINIQDELQASKQELEARVISRTVELESAKNEAEIANLSKTKFLAATSHDLMQPLNAASLFATMLADKIDNSNNIQQNNNAKQKQLAANLINSLDNAEELLSMLVEITKLENNRITPNLTHFPLHDLLSSLFKDFAVIAEQKSVTLVYIPTSIWVHTDRRLLSRILQNLLSNAIRYTQKGKIVLGVRRKQKMDCNIVVADNGKGIAVQYQQSIFAEFERIDPDDNHPGLGLGLTIVERIVRLLKLELKLYSQVNKGSQFALSMTRSDSPKVNIQAQNKQSDLKDSNTENKTSFLQNSTALVLENDPAVSQALLSLFSEWGAKVYAASDKESLDKIIDLNESSIPIDIVIADYHLNSGDNGIAICSKLQQLGYNSLFILSSADRSESIQELAYDNNMLYLPKPIKQAALKRLIQQTK